MKFSSMLLYVNDEFPSLSVFKKVMETENHLYRSRNNLYSIEQAIVDDRFYWVYFQYDNEFLYTNVVIDTIDNSEKTNPRPKNLVEMRSQLFACYDISRQMLYVSDYQKKGTITKYLNEVLQVPVATKNILTSVEDFVESVKYLKSVVFTQKKTLYTADNDSIFRKIPNLYGLDLPEKCKVHLDYGATPIGVIKNALRDWKLKRESGEFEEVIVIGTDDSGLENSFNFSTMIASVEIDASKDDNYRYDPDIVRILLLAKLGG